VQIMTSCEDLGKRSPLGHSYNTFSFAGARSSGIGDLKNLNKIKCPKFIGFGLKALRKLSQENGENSKGVPEGDKRGIHDRKNQKADCSKQKKGLTSFNLKFKLGTKSNYFKEQSSKNSTEIVSTRGNNKSDFSGKVNSIFPINTKNENLRLFVNLKTLPKKSSMFNDKSKIFKISERNSFDDDSSSVEVTPKITNLKLPSVNSLESRQVIIYFSEFGIFIKF
jgi:hypothetical protein